MPVIDLKINLKELSESILRELYLAEKKLSFYTRNHPAIERTLEKPFGYLNSYFQIKNSLVIRVEGKKIWASGILVSDSIATRALISDFSVFNLQNVVLLPQVTISELYIFLNRLQEKIAPNKLNLDLSRYLKEQNINTILVNSKIGEELNFQGYPTQDFSQLEKDRYQAERIIRKVLLRNPDLMVEMAWHSFNQTLKLSPDFRLEAYLKVLPSVLNEIDEQMVYASLSQKIEANLKTVTEQNLRGIKLLLKMFPDPGKKEHLIGHLKSLFFTLNLPAPIFESVLDETSKIKVKVYEKSEELLESLKSTKMEKNQLAEWPELFFKFIRLRQSEKLKSLILALVSGLISDDRIFRRNCFTVLQNFIDILSQNPEEEGSYHLKDLLTTNAEQEEVSQLLLFWTQKCLETRDYAGLAELVKKLENKAPSISDFLNQPANLNQITADLKKSPQQKWTFKKILKFIGTSEVVAKLTGLFTHPDRNLRQVSLSVLTELGPISARVFARMFMDQKNWQRSSDRITLTSSSWYMIRNILHLWGRINFFDAWEILEQKLSDPDFKVRREIAKTLEKIGGERSIQILSRLINDKTVSVKKTAILGLGLIGSEKEIPVLKRLFQKDAPWGLAVVYAIKNIGGEEAKRFFLEILDKEKIVGKSIIIRESEKKIIQTVVEGLRKMPDTQVQQKLQQFQDSLTKTQKIFLNPKSLISN